MTLPRKLSTIRISPNYNPEACKRVDRVFVDGHHFPQCVAYDMDAGWALFKGEDGVWLPKKYGVITVTERQR